MIAPSGIAFSNKKTCVISNGTDGVYTECLLDTIPALKCSLYFSLQRYNSPATVYKEPQDLEAIVSQDLIDVYKWDFERFHDDLNCIEHFKGILELLTQRATT